MARAVAAGARLSNGGVARMLAREGYGYEFADDPLNAGGFGPSDATIRVRPGPVRTTLLRPRPESAATADVPSQTPEATWDARFRAMSEAMDRAGHTQAKNPLRGTGTAKIDSKMSMDKLLKQKLPGARSITYGPEAYTAPLQPGDMVFYLFKDCQYGGHAVTVIDDLGDSFTHISGNAGDAISVAIGEAKRMKAPPSGPETFVLGKACPGPVAADPNEPDQEKAKAEAAKKTKEKQTEATAYIKKFNFGDQHLVYSITRYGSLLAGLESPKPQ